LQTAQQKNFLPVAGSVSCQIFSPTSSSNSKIISGYYLLSLLGIRLLAGKILKEIEMLGKARSM